MTVSRTGTTPTPFGFVGGSQYQSDADSGLMLLGNRYYDASIGRFISSDPAKAGTNWFAYCENNPSLGTDSLGLSDDNNGAVRNNTGDLQYGLGGFDPGHYREVPYKGEIPKQYPLPPGSAIPPSILVPKSGNHPWYPVWHTTDPWGGGAYIFPVAPGTTVGGNGVDIDAGWDSGRGIWVKTPGQDVVIKGIHLPVGSIGYWDPPMSVPSVTFPNPINGIPWPSLPVTVPGGFYPAEPGFGGGDFYKGSGATVKPKNPTSIVR